MDKTNKILVQLHEIQEYKDILLGKGDYSNFIKRQEALSSVLVKYLQGFNESYFYEFDGKDHAISEIEKGFETLNECCRSFLHGDIAAAINRMYGYYFGKDVLLKTVPLSQGNHFFFRMRNATNYELYKEEEMFHIPFEKNYLIKNERFSISGFPSLYLGKSVYVCWEELGRPDFDHANVAVYNNSEECTVIDLCMPAKIEDIIRSLQTLPMILSSSLPVLNPGYDFKPEYIIPQLLMQCVVRYNKKSGKAIDGIKYDSIHKYSGESFYDYHESGLSNLYENYVFPARHVSDSGHCPILKDRFVFGCSDSFARYDLEDYESTKNHEDSIENKYEKSKFHAMEMHLFQVAKASMLPYSSKYGDLATN